MVALAFVLEARKGRPERASRLFVERAAQYYELTVLQDMLRLDSIPILCNCGRRADRYLHGRGSEVHDRAAGTLSVQALRS